MQKEEIQKIFNKQLGVGYINSHNDSIHRCPFCKHHKKKLSISISTQQWHCWVCHAKGKSVISLFKQINAPNYIIEELYKLLPKRIKNPKPDVKKYDIISLPNEFISLTIPSKSFLYKKCIEYILNRKLKISDIIKYNLGYCTTGEYASMIIIPSYNKYGNLNFFTAHAFLSTAKYKFKNPKADKNMIAFESTIAETEPVILVEAPFDAITVGRNSIPLNGKILSDELKIYIVESNITEIFICLDGDALKKSIETCNYFLSMGKKVFLVEMDFDKDPNELGHEQIWKKIQETSPLTEASALKYNLKVKFNEKYK